MKTRHVLARIAAVVTAAAAIVMSLGPAGADAADHRHQQGGHPVTHAGEALLGIVHVGEV